MPARLRRSEPALEHTCLRRRPQAHRRGRAVSRDNAAAHTRQLGRGASDFELGRTKARPDGNDLAWRSGRGIQLDFDGAGRPRGRQRDLRVPESRESVIRGSLAPRVERS